MERKVFLKNSLGFLGMAMLAPEMLKATHLTQASVEEALDCTVTNSETAGPFPTINPSSYATSNIVGDRTGVAFTANIYIKNKNAACAAYQNCIIDIWHCDKDGNYSQYGGTGMQPANYTAYNFLRGRQTTDADGKVTFTSIFPGWYTGRATHIHVHIYTASGTSLLVTQIAFPEGASSAVNAVNAATAYGYTKGMNGYTYNANDNVFSDGVTSEMSAVSGSLSGGYTLEHTIYVNGPSLGVDDSERQNAVIGQNYPNPFQEATTIPLILESASNVSLTVFDGNGRQTGMLKKFSLNAGANNLNITRSEYSLSSGTYIFTVKVQNAQGTFTQSRKMLVK
ncbi:T9SS type A sorting domain-containing protein [Flavobacterium sp.]|uniref:dioxygenase family protein n=1 Tax=Flavobacterium sp. TaxID=239 RepID=UPI00120F4F79|nr:T9SS type A sorting domain-containing protein [Flavobacterium sp.]RZJ71923.1 MAG: T9SS type A sorting domain-containing protein [Flavobacterium sp.]